MLLPFLFSQLLVLTIANPFHKYPYVFLLDVGNEEIETSVAEQIRLTIPGGSMAIKYPAIDEGDLIGHVRVSGIDFGTDLKASILDGGPGYKNVVILFTGNPGNSYDAVVTIQTMPSNSEENENSPTNSDNNDNDDDDVKDLDDNENSIENANDSGSMTVYTNGDSEVMQSSSNIYKYAVNDVVDSQQYGDDESSNNDDSNEQNNDYSESNNQSDNSYVKDDFSESDVSVNEKVSGTYTAFKPHFYGGVRFYPQAAVYTQSVYGQSDDDTDASVHEDEANQSAKYKDTNNHPDIDYASPVEY